MVTLDVSGTFGVLIGTGKILTAHLFVKSLGGVSNGHTIFELLAKFCLCSICLQNLVECSLARARKILQLLACSGSC